MASRMFFRLLNPSAKALSVHDLEIKLFISILPDPSKNPDSQSENGVSVTHQALFEVQSSSDVNGDV